MCSIWGCIDAVWDAYGTGRLWRAIREQARAARDLQSRTRAKPPRCMILAAINWMILLWVCLTIRICLTSIWADAMRSVMTRETQRRHVLFTSARKPPFVGYIVRGQHWTMLPMVCTAVFYTLSRFISFRFLKSKHMFKRMVAQHRVQTQTRCPSTHHVSIPVVIRI
jgi:hypothetical protein